MYAYECQIQLLLVENPFLLTERMALQYVVCLQVGDDLQKLATAAVEDVGRFDEFVVQRNAQRDEKRRMWYARVD